MNWVGNWSALVAYQADDAVTHDGQSWVALATTTVALPPADPQWQLLAAKGSQGDVGPQGPQGLNGDTGLTGATGDTGPQGPQGIAGLTGGTGPQGPQGDTGLAGAPGSQGPAGPEGPTGPQGPSGDPTVLYAAQTAGASSAVTGGSVPGASLTFAVQRDGTVLDISATGGLTATAVGNGRSSTCGVTLVVDGTPLEAARVPLSGTTPYSSFAFTKRLTVNAGPAHTVALEVTVVSGNNSCDGQNAEWDKFHLYVTIR